MENSEFNEGFRAFVLGLFEILDGEELSLDFKILFKAHAKIFLNCFLQYNYWK